MPHIWPNSSGVSASDGLGLTPTPVQNSNYTAAPGDFVLVDTTTRNVTISLPTAPLDKSEIAVKLVTQNIANSLRVSCGGADVFNKAGGPTSEYILTEEQTILVQYQASGAIWYVIVNSLPARATGLNDPFIKLFPTAGGSQVGIDMENGSGWADAIRLPNNVPLRAYNSGATAKNIANLDSGNILSIGDSTIPLNIVTDTSTGMKIGTSTSQKIGAYNTTPVVQPTTAGAAAAFTANAGTAVNDASTFDGYTIPQIVKALRNLGWLA